MFKIEIEIEMKEAFKKCFFFVQKRCFA